MKHLNTKLRTLLGAVIFSIVFILSISAPVNGGTVTVVDFEGLSNGPLSETQGVLFTNAQVIDYFGKAINPILVNDPGNPITITFPAGVISVGIWSDKDGAVGCGLGSGRIMWMRVFDMIGGFLAESSFGTPGDVEYREIGLAQTGDKIIGKIELGSVLCANPEISGAPNGSWVASDVWDDLTFELATPTTHIQFLIENVRDFNLEGGLENSLVSKLENAIKSLDKGKVKPAVNQLNAFINEVNAQRGKKITDAIADALIATARWIIDHI